MEELKYLVTVANTRAYERTIHNLFTSDRTPITEHFTNKVMTPGPWPIAQSNYKKVLFSTLNYSTPPTKAFARSSSSLGTRRSRFL